MNAIMYFETNLISACGLQEIPLNILKIDRFSFVDLGYYDYWVGNYADKLDENT